MFNRGLFNRLPFNAGNLVLDTLARLKVIATSKARIAVTPSVKARMKVIPRGA